ncbi:alpha/beta fold hydrolase [Paenibacillus chitinolyticus]
MFRDLIERLSNPFHIFAPDYPGLGYSDAPSTETFAYTFDRLDDIVEKLQ